MATAAQEAWYAAQKARRAYRQRILRARNAEKQYAVALRKIAQQIGLLASTYDPANHASLDEMQATLRAYAKVLEPWARNTATRMIADVAQRDESFWREQGSEIGRALAQEIASAPTGDIMKRLMAEQVGLITSLPLDAAQRVHRLAIAAITESRRPDEIAQMIRQTGEVTESRATLIARTETARTAATLTQARAQWIGSEGYIWRTMGDADVRPALGMPEFAELNTKEKGSHRLLEGTFIRWDAPPIAGTRGERAHAGCIYNCRCYSEVVFPQKMMRFAA